jgi:hypothetical protein
MAKTLADMFKDILSGIEGEAPELKSLSTPESDAAAKKFSELISLISPHARAIKAISRLEKLAKRRNLARKKREKSMPRARDIFTPARIKDAQSRGKGFTKRSLGAIKAAATVAKSKARTFRFRKELAKQKKVDNPLLTGAADPREAFRGEAGPKRHTPKTTAEGRAEAYAEFRGAKTGPVDEGDNRFILQQNGWHVRPLRDGKLIVFDRGRKLSPILKDATELSFWLRGIDPDETVTPTKQQKRKRAPKPKATRRAKRPAPPPKPKDEQLEELFPGRGAKIIDRAGRLSIEDSGQNRLSPKFRDMTELLAHLTRARETLENR